MNDFTTAIGDIMLTTIPTGLTDLDECLAGGMRAGQLIVIAGHPNHGASTTAHTIARHVAEAPHRSVLIAALESTTNEIIARMLSATARVPFRRMQTGHVTDEEVARVQDAGLLLGERSIMLDQDLRSLDEITLTLGAFNPEAAPHLLVVDGAHLLAPSHDYGGRAQFADDDARRLKELAVEYGMVVLATLPLEMSGAHTRYENRPHLRDFGKRQAYAQTADVVILPWRPDEEERESPRAGEIDLIVAKNRNGVQWTIVAAFQGHYARVVSIAKQDRTPEAKADFSGLLDSFFGSKPKQP